MKRFRGVHLLICLVLLFGVLGGLFGSQGVFAAQDSANSPFLSPPNQEDPPVEEKIELTSQFPVVGGESGTTFEFEVQIYYQGSEPKIFNLILTPTPGWEASVKRKYKEEEASILALRVLPTEEYAEKFTILFSPLPGNLPEPGDYFLTLEAASGSLKDSVELKAEVTDIPLTYELDMVTTTGRLDTVAKAGKDNTISFKLTNSGTGVIKGINFIRVVSEGWNTKFAPSEIESLEPGMSQIVEVVITPPSRTIAADYNVILRSIGDNAADSINLRVKVQTPTIWGRAGIGIIAGIIVGLVIVFRRFGRR